VQYTGRQPHKNLQVLYKQISTAKAAFKMQRKKKGRRFFSPANCTEIYGKNY